jgi:hypothetical protein
MVAIAPLADPPPSQSSIPRKAAATQGARLGTVLTRRIYSRCDLQLAYRALDLCSDRPKLTERFFDPLENFHKSPVEVFAFRENELAMLQGLDRPSKRVQPTPQKININFHLILQKRLNNFQFDPK